MTWLSGSTTWGNCIDDLTKLACGEIADGNSVTCAAGDQWVREIGGQNLLRTKTSLDVALGNMSNRSGYFSVLNQKISTASTTNSMVPDAAYCRTTNVFTSNPATSFNRWVVRVAISTANTAAGNYSTLRFQRDVYEADTGVLVNQLTARAPNAAGAYTDATYGFQLEFGSPDGFVLLNQVYMRAFTTTYLGGVDWWGPYYSRRNGSHSFSVNPSGTTVTDWDVVDIPCASNQSTWLAPALNGGMAQGLGIKTNTGLSGALYTVTWSASLNKIRMFSSTAGIISLDHGGGGKVDTVNGSVYRPEAGYSIATWVKAFATPASVTAGAAIQYWMSVKADKIIVILNADPANTGKLGWGYMMTYNSPNSAYDKFPWVYNGGITDYTAETTTQSAFTAVAQISLLGQKKRQDASEGRTWQTGWMRADFVSLCAGTDTFAEIGQACGWTTGTGNVSMLPIGYRSRYDSAGFTAPSLIPAASAKPNLIDGKWWLFGTWWSNSYGSVSRFPTAMDYPIGYTDDVLFIPHDGWAIGDTLDDTLSSNNYFIIAADYSPTGRIHTAVSVFAGGSAILME